MDAAYNYEYVSRVRDQVARTRRASRRRTSSHAAGRGGRRSAGRPHDPRRVPARPPPDTKTEEMKMIAPMDYGDREAQPEATPGGKRERKG